MSADPIIFPVPDPSIRNPKDYNSVWFEWKDDKDEQASQAAGHPVFDSVVLAHIMGPGMQKSESTRIILRKKPDGTVSDYTLVNPNGLINPLNVYAQFLQAFLKGDPGHLAGTPLPELSILDTGAIATLKALGVHNIEGLANMAETAGGMLGFRKYKTAAAAYLKQRAGQEPLNKLAAENERLRTELDTVQRNHDDLAARVRELEESKGRRKAA